jgi:site-specific DNA-methyltransferase (adenine-specific)
MWIYGSGFPKSHNHFGLEGYGTALKPAYEPIIMAMKPLDGTFAQNAEKWGLAGINIDQCRIGEKTELHASKPKFERNGFIKGFCQGTESKVINHGRWPANVLFDEEAAQLLDEQSGINASRFFYCAKASARERNAGLEGMPEKIANSNFGKGGFSRPTDQPLREIKPAANHHPTVKPLKLMQYLIKLVMPSNPNAVLLDPFAGSGTTLLAAKQLGFKAIGIEKEKEYCEIALKRLQVI